MGFQDIVARRCTRWRYERLMKGVRRRSRRCCLGKKMKGFRLSPRSRKLTLKALSVLVFWGKMIRLYGDIIERMKKDGLCPNIVFSTQWGLPALSYPSMKCRKGVVIC